MWHPVSAGQFSYLGTPGTTWDECLNELSRLGRLTCMSVGHCLDEVEQPTLDVDDTISWAGP